jgi:thioredoxin
MAVLELSQTTFNEEVLQENRLVIVDFWTSYCTPCQALSAILEEASAECTNVKFCKINVDKAQAIAERYGVMSLPILIFFKGGEPVDEHIGLITKEELLTMAEKNK